MILKKIFVILIILNSSIILAQTRRALVIGLGEQEDRSWCKINGDKDVPMIKEMLLNTGYWKENIETLVNQQATKNGIITAFEKLIKECRRNDIIYIHFSGHGQRVTDVDGDEKDGWDESWIPYDAYKDYGAWDKGEKHLIDDEIYNYLKRVKKAIGISGKILVVVDACHSGGSSYGLDNLSFRMNFPIYGTSTILRGVSMPFIIPCNIASNKVKAPEQWITLSACSSFQVNQEMNNPQVGILSYALFSISMKGTVKMCEIEDFIKQNKGPYPQTPVLTGEVDKYKLSDFFNNGKRESDIK